MSELLGDVEGLPEEEPVFQSSGAAFEIKSDDGHPVLRMIGIFVFIICGLGVANGLDFISPESGLVRPHEWINGMPLRWTGKLVLPREDLPRHLEVRTYTAL